MPSIRPVAGLILRNADANILLIRRQGEGTWGIPGGGLEPGESWTDAALRECLEETGWVAQTDGLFGVYSDPRTQVHRYPGGAARQFVGVVLLATAVRDTKRRDGEAAELRWVAPDDLPAPLFPPDAPVLADYLNPSVEIPVIA